MPALALSALPDPAAGPAHDLWRATVVATVAPTLPHLQACALPVDRASLARFGASLAASGDLTPAVFDPEVVGRERAQAVIGALALEAGWVVTPTMTGVRFRRGTRELDLFARYGELLDGRSSAGAWTATCAEAGLAATVADLTLGPSASPSKRSLDDSASMTRSAPRNQPVARASRPLTYRSALRTSAVSSSRRMLTLHGDVLSWGTEWIRAGDVVAVAYGHHRCAGRTQARVRIMTATTDIDLRLWARGRDAERVRDAWSAVVRWLGDVVEPMLVQDHLEAIATFGQADVAGVLVQADGMTVTGLFLPWSDVGAITLDGSAVVIAGFGPHADTIHRVAADEPGAVLLPKLFAVLQGEECSPDSRVVPASARTHADLQHSGPDTKGTPWTTTSCGK